MGRNAKDLPKSLVPVGGKPLLEWLLGHVRHLHRSAAPPVLIVDHADTQVADLVHRSLPTTIVVRQPAPDGVAAAIALTGPHLVGDALVVLGDIVLDGFFREPWPKAPAVGVWRKAPPVATEQNFGVWADAHGIRGFIEKPAHARDLVCGIGVYLLPRAMIEELRDAPANPASGEREITAAIEAARARGAVFNCLEFDGFYWNVNSGFDRGIAERHLCAAESKDAADIGGSLSTSGAHANGG